MKPFSFTTADAQHLVETAEAAPCANIAAAKNTAQMIERFAEFYPIAMEAIKYQIDSEARIQEQVDLINKKLAASTEGGGAGDPA